MNLNSCFSFSLLVWTPGTSFSWNLFITILNFAQSQKSRQRKVKGKIFPKNFLQKFSQKWKMFLSNQITGFFDHQYLWLECINIFDFLHGYSHQVKVVSDVNGVNDIKVKHPWTGNIWTLKFIYSYC